MSERTPQMMLNDFMDGLSQAFGGCWQMAHMHSDPRWLEVRDGIGSVKDTCVKLMLKYIGRSTIKDRFHV